MSTTAVRDILALGPVMPVVVIDRADRAAPLARALLAGGIRAIEVTMRTPAALDAVRSIRDEVPAMAVGAGTILGPADLSAAMRAGSVFGVSPGATRELLQAARDGGLPLLPGVMTPSDILQALAQGYDTLKFFPARPAGGVPMLSAFAGPFAGVRFCPTGGIDFAGAPAYLALPNVACVGGTWIAPRELIEREDWAAIEAIAREAARLARPGPHAAAGHGGSA